MSEEKPKYKQIELTNIDEWPVCPYCQKEIEQLVVMNVRRGLGIFYCPHCRKVLGTSTTM